MIFGCFQERFSHWMSRASRDNGPYNDLNNNDGEIMQSYTAMT